MGIPIQCGAVITQSNLSLYYIRHHDDSNRKSIRFQTHNRHPITRPYGVSYGVSIMRILKKIDRIITTTHCTWKDGLYKETGSRSIITWHCIHLHLFVTTGQLKLVLCIAGDHWLPHVKILAWFTLFLIRHVYAKNAHNYKNPEMKYGNWISLTLHIYPQGCCVIGIYCDHSRDKH